MKFCSYSFLKASTGFIRAARHAGKKPDSTPVSAETISEMPTTTGDNSAGIILRRSNVDGHAMSNAITPPIRQMNAASIRNCSRIVRRFAPMALRTPIYRVRSATETNMMFMMPMPPTNSASPVMKSPMPAMVPATR